MKILAGQIDVPETRTAEAVRAHAHDTASRVRAAAAGKTFDLVLLPELSAIEYSDTAFAALPDLMPAMVDVHAKFADLADDLGAPVCYGHPGDANGKATIRQTIVSPDGSVQLAYDKIHIAQFGDSHEAATFAPGSTPGLAEVGGRRVGVSICYDLRFPELYRALAVTGGADVILHPVAFARDVSFPSWHSFAITRAMENQVWFLSLNRAGVDWGKSILAPPAMDDDHLPLIFGDGEEFRLLDLDDAAIQRAREVLPFRKDLASRG